MSFAPWTAAQCAYMPNVGTAIATLSTPARQNSRVSQSIASSLPRPSSRFSAGTP
jgi:hypothetical protein